MRKKIKQLTGALAVVMQRVVQWLAKRYALALTADKEQALRAAKELGEKLRHQRAETLEWRARALSAEQTLRNAKAELRKAITQHDEKHGTTIGFLW